MDTQEHLEEAREWRRSAVLNRNCQGNIKGQYILFDSDESYLDAAHRCELRAEYHEQFISPGSDLLRGYYNRD